MKRLFAAIELEDSVVGSIRRLQEECQSHLDGSMRVRWTPPENLHVTLKFLGATESDLVDPIADLLDDHALDVDPFEMEIGNLGAFPRPNHPRILWVGVDSTSNAILTELHRDVEEALKEKFGIEEDEHAFKGHITFGRVKSSRAPNLARLSNDLPRGPFGTVDVEEICLYESERTPSGAEYTVLHRSPLGGR